MRTFYLFEIKEKVLKNYKNNYEDLYLLLEKIHYLTSEDIVLGFNIFEKIVKPLNKEVLNKHIKDNNISSENYICYNYTHIINDFYLNESTKLIINNSHMKIKSNKNVPSFFFNIRKIPNIFVCDFNNHDYFLLESTIYNPCIYT